MDIKDGTRIASVSETTVSPFRTGTWRKSRPVYEDRLAPCTESCPCGENIPAWMHLASEGKFEAAWRELITENPFPLICGRVCYRFCEVKCNRGGIDETISINAVERFLGEWAMEHGSRPEPANATAQGLSVAVVGGGPAGLSAAHRLARAGADVTVYDEHEELGGMLRYGIPEYRLPKELMRREIRVMIEEYGVKTVLRNPITLENLKKIAEEHDYVLLAQGAHRSRTMRGNNGITLPFMDGLLFLSLAASQKINRDAMAGQCISVIGGGNTAIDVARTALRLGAKEVTVVYRRREEDMPAHKDEIAEAKHEGVRFQFLALPTNVDHDPARGTLLECVPVVLRATEGGRSEPVPDATKAFALPTDMTITAIGEEVEWEILGDRPHDFRGESDIRDGNLLASGDALTGPRSVSEAIASGKRAADGIIERHLGRAVSKGTRRSIGQAEIKFHYLAPSENRVRGRHALTLSKEDMAEFRETTSTISEESARREAARCINCGSCIVCDRCLSYCPDYAILAKGDGTYDINLDMCKGCGLCAEVCERGVISLIEGETNENA